MSKWDTYYKVHASRKPRDLTVRASKLCKHKEKALDLGAGTLIETIFLLGDGFKKVVALDASEETRTFAKDLDQNKLQIEICSYQDFDFGSEEYDLINAQYALPFHGPASFEKFISDIKTSLKPDGIFTGQFFGIRDEWNTEDTKLTFQTREEALNLLKDLEVVEFEEEEKEAGTAAGTTKHWHVFHFIAKK